RKFCDTSSIVATARPWLSCPVTTRRTRRAIGSPPLVRENPLPQGGRGGTRPPGRVGEGLSGAPTLTRLASLGTRSRCAGEGLCLLGSADRALLLELRRLLRRGFGLGGDRGELAVALGGDLAHVRDNAAGTGRDQPPDDDILLQA